MPYVKPGVEVKQVQKTATPILNSPELTATIVGRGYWWQDPTWEDEANIVYGKEEVMVEMHEHEHKLSGIRVVIATISDRKKKARTQAECNIPVRT